jgi:hypothetical protein
MRRHTFLLRVLGLALALHARAAAGQIAPEPSTATYDIAGSGTLIDSASLRAWTATSSGSPLLLRHAEGTAGAAGDSDRPCCSCTGTLD